MALLIGDESPEGTESSPGFVFPAPAGPRRFGLGSIPWVLLLAGADQIAKEAALRLPPGGLPLGGIAGISLVLRTSTNRGISFSALAGHPSAGSWAALVGLCLLGALTLRPPGRPWTARALSLLWGGALGNAADRIFRPGVLDWLDLVIRGARLSVNLADLWLLLGGGILAAALLVAPGSSPIRRCDDAGTRWGSPPRSP